MSGQQGLLGWVPESLVAQCWDAITIPAVGDVMLPVSLTPGRAFDIDALLVFECQDVAGQIFHTRLRAYNSVTGVAYVRCVKVLEGAAGEYASWGVYQIDGPPPGMAMQAIDGLVVKRNASDRYHDIDMSSGSVRDSTNTVDLVLTSPMTKRLDAPWAAGSGEGAYVQTADLDGTITSTGLNIAGSLTAFLTELSATAALTNLEDYFDFGSTAGIVDNFSGVKGVISAAGVTTLVKGVSNDTTAQSEEDLGAAGDPYRRGGWVTSSAAGDVFYGLGLCRKDEDGTVDVFLSSFTPSGAPDLPDGYTKYRLTHLVIARGGVIKNIVPAGLGKNVLGVPVAIFRAVVTPTLLSGNISSVDTGTEEITWNSDLRSQVGGYDVFPIIPAVGGTWPTGVTTRGLLYGRFATGSNTVFTLHDTYDDAKLGANAKNLTGAGSGTRIAHTLALSGIAGSNYGMDDELPIGGSGTYETTLGFAFNFAAGVDVSNALIELQIDGLVAGTTAHASSRTAPFPTLASDKAVYRGSQNAIPLVGNTAAIALAGKGVTDNVGSTVTLNGPAIGGVGTANGTVSVPARFVQPSTWQAQGTTPITVQLKAWR